MLGAEKGRVGAWPFQPILQVSLKCHPWLRALLFLGSCRVLSNQSELLDVQRHEGEFSFKFTRMNFSKPESDRDLEAFGGTLLFSMGFPWLNVKDPPEV